MRSGLARWLLTFATFAVVWVVAPAAFAADKAPLCDPRAAITFAPPPQIQDPQMSLDIDLECPAPDLLIARAFAEGRGAIDLLFSQETMTLTDEPVVGPAEHGSSTRDPASVDVTRPGFGGELERPPRG